LFVAAIVAGTSKSYGQVDSLPNTSTYTIDPLNCTTDWPLHPRAGVSYTYSMSDVGETPVDQWFWFATKDTSFITPTGGLNSGSALTTPLDLLNTSANYNTWGDADTVSITWSPQILAGTEYEGDLDDPSPTFVVGYATGDLCADNIEVYEIDPKPSFVIDIANVVDGVTLPYDSDTSSCVSEVYSAHYRVADDSLIMNYGWDTLYFEVAASNFVDYWTPYFYMSDTSLHGSQTAEISIAEDYGDFASNTLLGGPTSFAIGDTVTFSDIQLTAEDPSDIVNGVSAWVRVVIANNTYESIQSNTFTLLADAIDGSSTWDMEDDDCDTETNEKDGVDYANHVILPRPELLDNTADDESIEPNTVIDKQRE